ncbi:hypothetical protein [Acetobacter sp. KSO5]|uniref:hypothetical protein n=1 Tax=Acetobacter sp. KSO5 TaxID=3373674 RepID=UPI00376F0155
MTWQLFSPDLPFLNQITVFQVRHGIWENIVASAPALGVAASIFSAGVALYVAKLARNIASEQKEIAKNKLDLDLFDKRLEIFNSFFNNGGEICFKKFKTEENLQEVAQDLINSFSKVPFLFNEKETGILSKARENLILIASIKRSQIKEKGETEETKEIISKSTTFTNTDLIDISNIMISCTPTFIYEGRSLPKKTPAINPIPQPTAPEQAQ